MVILYSSIPSIKNKIVIYQIFHWYTAIYNTEILTKMRHKYLLIEAALIKNSWLYQTCKFIYKYSTYPLIQYLEVKIFYQILHILRILSYNYETNGVKYCFKEVKAHEKRSMFNHKFWPLSILKMFIVKSKIKKRGKELHWSDNNKEY